MTRFSSVISLLFSLLLAGCGDSYRPVRREAPAAPEVPVAVTPDVTPSPHGADMTASPHGADLTASPHGAKVLGNSVDAGAIQLTAPDVWVRKPPRSGFVLAEFALPAAEGDQRDGRLTVSVAGGSIEANVDRWRSQFGGSPEKDAQEEIDVSGLKVTVVDFAGTFNDQAGPFAPGTTREGYRMLAAIVPVGSQLHFVKAYGPAQTMAQHEDAFRDFLQTIKSK